MRSSRRSEPPCPARRPVSRRAVRLPGRSAWSLSGRRSDVSASASSNSFPPILLSRSVDCDCSSNSSPMPNPTPPVETRLSGFIGACPPTRALAGARRREPHLEIALGMVAADSYENPLDPDAVVLPGPRTHQGVPKQSECRRSRPRAASTSTSTTRVGRRARGRSESAHLSQRRRQGARAALFDHGASPLPSSARPANPPPTISMRWRRDGPDAGRRHPDRGPSPMTRAGTQPRRRERRRGPERRSQGRALSLCGRLRRRRRDAVGPDRRPLAGDEPRRLGDRREPRRALGGDEARDERIAETGLRPEQLPISGTRSSRTSRSCPNRSTTPRRRPLRRASVSSDERDVSPHLAGFRGEAE